jgi:hypothetical protein
MESRFVVATNEEFFNKIGEEPPIPTVARKGSDAAHSGHS